MEGSEFEGERTIAVAEEEVEFFEGEVTYLEAVWEVVLADAAFSLHGAEVGSVIEGGHRCAICEVNVGGAVKFKHAAFELRASP